MKIQKPLPKVVVKDNKVFYGNKIIGYSYETCYGTINNEQKVNYEKHKAELSHIFTLQFITHDAFYDIKNDAIIMRDDKIHVYKLNPEYTIYK
jgi:hypothetical protein